MNKKKTKKEIKKMLLEQDVKQTAIAKKAKVTRAAISMTISGDLESERLRRVIAKVLGKDVSDVWPSDAA